MKKVDINQVVVKNNETISTTKSQLELVLDQLKSLSIYNCGDELNSETYLLVDRNLNEAYTFLKNDLNNWEKDGSFEVGDMLFKLEFVKQF